MIFTYDRRYICSAISLRIRFLSFSFIKQKIKTVQFVDLDLTVISLQIVYVREWLCKTGFSKDILITFVIGLCTLCDLE